METDGQGDSVTEAGPNRTDSGPSSEVVIPAAPVGKEVVSISSGNSGDEAGDVATEPTQVCFPATLSPLMVR